MSSKKLFVFEGQKTEINITKNLADQFSEIFPDLFASHDVTCAYCTTIYDMYKTLVEDEYLDMFMLLKEKEFNKEILQNFNRSDFAEIYLFFDYDGHAPIASDENLAQIIELFSEETEYGKIFISYPMVEALKHQSDEVEFKELKVLAKTNIRYKKNVNKTCSQELIDFNNYNKVTWIKLIGLHLRKMNYIVVDNFDLPTENYSQDIIFNKQKEKYIDIDLSIAVLSSFPVFIFDYYGVKVITNLLRNQE